MRKIAFLALAPLLAVAASLPQPSLDAVGCQRFIISHGTNTLDLGNFRCGHIVPKFSSWIEEARQGDICSWQTSERTFAYAFDGQAWRDGTGASVNEQAIPLGNSQVSYYRSDGQETMQPVAGNIRMDVFAYSQARTQLPLEQRSNWNSFGGAHDGSRPDRQKVDAILIIGKGDTTVPMAFTYGDLKDSPYFVNTRILGLHPQHGDAISWQHDGKTSRWAYDTKDWISPEGRHHAAFVIPIAAKEFVFHRDADQTDSVTVSGYTRR